MALYNNEYFTWRLLEAAHYVTENINHIVSILYTNMSNISNTDTIIINIGITWTKKHLF